MAQTTTSYYCDFEDAAENAQWVLNAGTRGATSKNHWQLGAAGSFGIGSTQGLYMADTADVATCGYNATNFSCFQSSYRVMTLATGNYTIQFDWKALGNPNDELIVLWVPSTQTVASSWSTTDQALPTSWNGWNKAIHLRGSASWQSYTGTLNVTSNGGKLVVMWANKKGVSNAPGGAIDNIRIYQGAPCTGPTSVVYNMKGQKLTWSGGPAGSSYDVLVYNFQTASFSSFNGVTQNSYSIPSLTQEGMYYFYVRANCGDSLRTSDWISTSQFVWIPGARCLDYMDLDGTTCYRGPFDNVTGGSGAMRGKVDNGYWSIESFHTLHYVPGETDPRTNNKLKTIPDGEIASVRLGNWRDDNGIGGMGAGEAIEYKYQVKAGQSDIMEIQYAVVMEKPGHNDGTDPHFTLEILDRNGKQIGGNAQACFMADFAASSNNPQALKGWNELSPSQLPGVEGVGYDNIIWKPWTLISVSLRNYVGQTLTIRLTTKDCRQQAHWAYAYFTIGCRGGDLQGIACGDYSTDHFDAPEGFDYRWYWEGDPSTILGTNQRFDITSTTDSIYVVDVISKTAGGCYYSLTANPNPRYPKAIASVLDKKPRNCENRLKMQNDCRIYFINRKDSTGMTSQETQAVEEVYWNWGDGTSTEANNDATVEHVFPTTGGTFRVMTVATMSGGICTDTLWTDVTFPDITDPGASDDIHLCRAETPTYEFSDGTVIWRDTAYTTYKINQYGCDVPQVHNVFFHDSVQSIQDTSFCEGGYIDFHGTRYDKTGHYVLALKTVHGCDSTLELELNVIPRLQIKVEPTYVVCGDSMLSIPFEVVKGRYNGMQVLIGDRAYTFDDEEDILIPMNDSLQGGLLRPNIYDVTLVLGTPDCPADNVHVQADVRYASFIIYQKHGIIGLYNADHNGYHTDFVGCTYQWYCDGEAIAGAVGPYIYVTDADYFKHYHVEIISPDGQHIISCPITYTYARTDIPATEAERGDWVGCYDMLGRYYSELPHTPGVYVMVYTNQSYRTIVR